LTIRFLFAYDAAASNAKIQSKEKAMTIGQMMLGEFDQVVSAVSALPHRHRRISPPV
jgi:hypothetical protein